MCAPMCVCVELGVCGNPEQSNWDRIFQTVQTRSWLNHVWPHGWGRSGSTAPLDDVYAADWFSGSSGRGERMWEGGTRLCIRRKEVQRSVAFGPCAAHCVEIFFFLLLSPVISTLSNQMSVLVSYTGLNENNWAASFQICKTLTTRKSNYCWVIHFTGKLSDRKMKLTWRTMAAGVEVCVRGRVINNCLLDRSMHLLLKINN